MAAKLVLPGRTVTAELEREPALEPYLDVQVLCTQVVDGSVRGVSAEAQVLEGVQETDIVELEYQEGVKQWLSVAQMREDLAARTTQREAAVDGEALRIPAAWPTRQRTRGATDWVLKGLKVLRIDPAGAAATAAGREIVAAYEKKTTPRPGLYRLTNPPNLDDPIHSADALNIQTPYLLFIHGTASSTSAAFARLFEASDDWAVLRQYYGDRILTLDHHTLSVSPVQNALDAVALLPAGARLHLVTHSRGGLVGELICLRELPPNGLQPFQKIGHPDAERLRSLEALLKQKNFRVERFVRIACPARGTILASKRIDLYFSTLLNLIGLIPALKANPIYAFIKATALELIKLRTKPEELPGLEAQMPESPLIHLLNRPDLATQADLAVIAGDIEGGGIWERLKIFATDVFYQEQHDLVVNTESMYGGMLRDSGGFRYFDQGPEVNHFNYFRNPESRQRLVAWLTEPEVAKKSLNFQPIVRRALDLTRTEARSTVDLPTLFLVPGLMASHLTDGNGARVWLDYQALAAGGLAGLAQANGKVSADGIIAPPYQRLSQYLAARYTVMPFAYDWRLSLLEAGQQLARVVRAQLDTQRQPIRLLAHSSGGLVVRAMIAQDKELWQELCQRGGRLVMLGTPNQGTFVSLRLLLGREKILRLLALLDASQGIAGLVNQFRRYPGLLELLPPSPDADFFNSRDWPAWDAAAGLDPDRVSPPAQAALRAAQQTQALLATAGIDPQHMIYVAGSAPRTPNAIYLEDGKLVFDVTRRGDGWTPYNLALLEGVPTWYMDAAYGDMADYPQAFNALLELLENGQTDKLSRETPPWQGGVHPYEPIREEEPLLFPNQEALVSAAMGGRTTTVESEAVTPLRVSVAHGSLRYASYPVAVGHYFGDTIVSAEAFLNYCLKGRLMERFRLDLYSGPVDTVEVIHAAECKPPGGLVIGLGEVGAISAEKIRRGITEAALRHALMVAEETRRSAAGTWQSAAFSALLLGTQGGGAISIGSAVTAIVQGALEANRVLRTQGLWDLARIDAVEFVELYEDTAIQAAHAIAGLEGRLRLDLAENEEIAVLPYLRVLNGGRYQAPINPYATGWWRRVQITQAEAEAGGKRSSGDLQFLALTDRARAEQTLSLTQRGLIDQLINAAVNSPGYSEDVASTLFELLIPTPLKELARDETDLVLVLDQEAAQYPWELLAERTRKGLQPLARRIKVLRQFKTGNYRLNPQPPRGRNALVIGDPVSSQVELPGAQAEAEQVADILQREGYNVTRIIRGDALAIISALFAREYRIIHLAGHGIYNPANPRESGMILGDQTFLTAAELRQMRVVPELVFINCCHLGRIDQVLTVKTPHKLAASIAQELIDMGVKAVVAAGWAVDDGAALDFAGTFYRQLVQDHYGFGDAVDGARQAIFMGHTNTNTWGAYQCYGNPDFQLTEERSSSGDQSAQPRYFSRREYFDKLRTIAIEAAEAEAGSLTALQADLKALDGSLPTQWRDGEMWATLARAWMLVEDIDSAAGAYQKAIMEADAQAPIDAFEQLARLKCRQAGQLRLKMAADGAEVDQKTVRQLIEDAVAWLEWLLKLGDSPARLRLLGQANKDLALLLTGQQRDQKLAAAEQYYRRAYEQANQLDAEAAVNWATLRYLLAGSQEDLEDYQAQLLEQIEECRQAVERVAQQDGSLQSRLWVLYAAILPHLVTGQLDRHAAEIAGQYQSVLVGSTASSAAAATRDQLDFLIEMLTAKRRTTLARSVATIRAAF